MRSPPQIKEEGQSSEGQHNTVYGPHYRPAQDYSHAHAKGHGEVPQEAHLLELHIVEKGDSPGGCGQGQHPWSEKGGCGQADGGEDEGKGPDLCYRHPAGGQGPARLVDPVHLPIEIVIGDICRAGGEKADQKSQEGSLQRWQCAQPQDLTGYHEYSGAEDEIGSYQVKDGTKFCRDGRAPPFSIVQLRIIGSVLMINMTCWERRSRKS